jgi:hypothetical protein
MDLHDVEDIVQYKLNYIDTYIAKRRVNGDVLRHVQPNTIKQVTTMNY